MNANQNSLNEMPVIMFKHPKDLADWLDKNHAVSSGLWLRLAKKAAGLESVTYDEALEVALCYGWIDGQKKTFDETAFLQKFTPRGRRSLWSKINVGHVARLEKEGRMKPAGLAAVATAKADGRWEAAYHSCSTAEMPEDFLTALEREPEAKGFFFTLNKTQRHGFFFRITTAKKPETRRKRIADFVAMLKRGEKLH